MATLYDTTDFKLFIQQALDRHRHTRQDLAAALGRSKASISQMLSGMRSIDPDLVEPIAAFLRLDPEESSYFGALVDLAIGSPRARQLALATVHGKQRHLVEQGVNSSLLVETASRWYFWPLVELARCNGFKPDPAWIAGVLLPPITVAEAQEALVTAMTMGLIAAELAPDPPVWTPSDVYGDEGRAAAERFRAGLALAAGCLEPERSKFNERHVSTTTFRLSEEQFKKIRARIREVEREIMVIAETATEELPDRVYQLQVQLFPVSSYTDSDHDYSMYACNQGDPPDIEPDTTE